MEIKTHRVLSSATTVEEWLEILADEVDILNEPEQITVGEVYTLLTHRDELQSRLQDTEGSEAIQQRVEEIDRRLLEKAEVIADAEDLPRHREQRSRAEGVRVFAWWWHLDEIVDGLRYLKQVPEQPRRKALMDLFSDYTQAMEKPLPSVLERGETYEANSPINFAVPDWKYVPITKFVDFWGPLYRTNFWSAEERYLENVRDVEQITKENLRALFEWKHGQAWEGASWKKKLAFERAMDNLKRLDEFKHYRHVTDVQVDAFWGFLSGITSGPIYKVLFLHLCRPLEFALYDQHVYRSWQFLIHSEIQEVEVPNDLDVYKQYNEFFSAQARKLHAPEWKARRSLDKALMTFGKFLKEECLHKSKETKP